MSNGFRRGFFASGGFTLVELSVVILLIGILVAIAVPVYTSFRSRAERSVCWSHQRHLEYALMRWNADHPDERFVTSNALPGDGEAYIDLWGNVPGDDERSLADYFACGHEPLDGHFCGTCAFALTMIIDSNPPGQTGPFDCPSNGTGIGAVGGACDYITDGVVVTCLTDDHIGLKADGTPFIHDHPVSSGWNHDLRSSGGEESGGKEEDGEDGSEKDVAPVPKTPLGNTFEEITANFAELIEEYHREHGRYPRSWGDYVFTDLGLDPGFWKEPVDHIIYSTSGSKIKIEPEDNCTFTVMDARGKERQVTWKSNWALWYDTRTSLWYFKVAGNNNFVVDISTLKVSGP